MTIADLIERLEKATGPVRELDLECWWWGKASHSVQPMDADYKAFNLKMNDAPRYTSSIDSALTLVPEGWGWLVRDFKGDGEEGAYADVPHLTIESNMDGQAFHKIPAIALCIACLRARAGGVK